MAKRGSIRVEIERTQGKNDQFQKIVNETEEFYKKVESNPLEISVGDVKHVVIGLQEIQREINKIRTDTNSNNRMLDFANTLETVANKAQGEFGQIGIMFKSVNDNTRKFATGLEDIMHYLGDSNFGVKFVDVTGQFKELQDRAESLYDTLKTIGEGTFDGREFSLYNGNFNRSDLIDRIELLRELKSVQEEMLDFDPDLRGRDFVSKTSSGGLQDLIDNDIKSLELLRKSGLETTKELENLREEFNDKIYDYSWDNDSFKAAKENIDDKEFYESSLQDLRNYINKREDLLKSLDTGYERNLFTDDEIESMRSTLSDSLSDAKSQLKELEQLKNIGKNIDFTEVVSALKEIKDVINEIKDAFEPLTTALNTEGTAFANMAKEGSASLDTLLDKLKELEDLIDNINKKDFNLSVVQQFSQKATQKLTSANKLDLNKKKAYELLEIYKQLYDSIEKFKGQNNLAATMVSSAAGNAFGGDIVDVMQELAGNDYGTLKSRIDNMIPQNATAIQAKIQEIINYYTSWAKQLNELSAKAVKIPSFKKVDELTNKIARAESGMIDPLPINSNKIDSKIATDGIENVMTEIKGLRNQAEEELKAIRNQIESTFDLSTVDMKRDAFGAILDSVYRQFVDLQTKIKSLDFGIEVPTGNIEKVVQVIDEEGKSAEGATPKKNAFTEANKKVAASMENTGDAGSVAVEGIKAEEAAVESMARTMDKSATKIVASQEEIENKYKTTFGGTGKVNKNLAEKFNKALLTAGIDVSSISAAFNEKSETVGKGDNKQVITYDTIKLIAKGTDALGKATTVTREYEVATGALIKQMGGFKDVKDTFDVKQEVETANSKVAELEKRMGSFKINLDDVKNAAKNITDQASLDVFENALDGANQKLKELKATLKSTHSLDPVTNAESMMANLNTTVEKLETNIKKFSNVEGFSDLSASLTTIRTKLQEYNDETDGMKRASIVQSVNKEIAKFNTNLDLVKAKHTEENRVLREQEKEYNSLISLQKQLYADKVKLEKAEYGSANAQILEGRVQARQEEYDKTLQAIQGTENYNAVKEKEKQLNEELSAVIAERRRKEEELAWTQKENAENALKDQEIEAAYKERANAIKAEMAAEKGLIAARKESEAFYRQEEQTRKAQEDAAWAEYRSEQEAAAEKERQINLAFSQKAAQEAAEAERELAQARKEASEYFAALDAQEKKEADIQKQKELNALYRERQTIITAIIKYNNKANTLKTDKAIQRAKDQKALDEKRLANIDEEINKYGELINLQKLDQQNERLARGLYDSNKTNSFNREQKQDIEEVNRLLVRREEVHNNILKLQNQLNAATGNKERAAIQEELDGQNAIYNVLKKKLAAYKDSALQRKVADQDSKFLEQELQRKSQKKIKAAAEADKADIKDQEQDYKDVLSLVEQLYDAQIALHKINTNTTGQVNTAERLEEIKQVKELSMLLKDVYGINVKDLSGSLDKNTVLIQTQKNKLLEKERQYKQEIVRLTAQALDKEATANKKIQVRAKAKQDTANKNYGKVQFNREDKFFENVMQPTIRSLGEENISQQLNSLVQQYTAAYKRIAAIRQQFANDPDAVNNIGLKNEFQDTALRAETLRKKIQEIFGEAQKFDQVPKIGEVMKLEDFDPDDIKSSLISYANAVTDGKIQIQGFNAAGTEMYGVINQGNGVIDQVTFALRDGTDQLYAYRTATDQVTNEWEDFKMQLVDGAKRIAGMYIGFQEGVQAFRTGVNYVKEIDLAMTELRKVTDETDASYKQFLKDAASTSSVIGSTISDFTEASANFARLGYSMEEAASMAETAIVYKNVADGLDTVEESTESIISTMKAFGIEANDTMSIIDKYNEVGNNFAITSAGIGEALQRSASALFEAGNTIDESIALVTAANSVVNFVPRARSNMSTSR